MFARRSASRAAATSPGREQQSSLREVNLCASGPDIELVDLSQRFLRPADGGQALGDQQAHPGVLGIRAQVDACLLDRVLVLAERGVQLGELHSRVEQRSVQLHGPRHLGPGCVVVAGLGQRIAQREMCVRPVGSRVDRRPQQADRLRGVAECEGRLPLDEQGGRIGRLAGEDLVGDRDALRDAFRVVVLEPQVCQQLSLAQGGVEVSRLGSKRLFDGLERALKIVIAAAVVREDQVGLRVVGVDLRGRFHELLQGFPVAVRAVVPGQRVHQVHLTIRVALELGNPLVEHSLRVVHSVPREVEICEASVRGVLVAVRRLLQGHLEGPNRLIVTLGVLGQEASEGLVGGEARIGRGRIG